MISPDKIVLGLCLLGGFLWIRKRSRSIDLENQKGRSLLGVFGILPAALLGEKYLFEWLHFDLYTNTAIKAATLIATFLIVGFGFLKPGLAETKDIPSQDKT
jgi:hypothetical protein